MDERRPPPSPHAGGVLIVLGLLIGCGIGLAIRQVTASVLAGGAVGVALALAIWLRDRR